mmetsp:Transcript_22757/g.51429  ORF Transcript_22757/g.51429 Transcript_22757/m.51429 type:complete len:341 (+) Transcript_22757:583-1605(+)
MVRPGRPRPRPDPARCLHPEPSHLRGGPVQRAARGAAPAPDRRLRRRGPGQGRGRGALRGDLRGELRFLRPRAAHGGRPVRPRVRAGRVRYRVQFGQGGRGPRAGAGAGAPPAAGGAAAGRGGGRDPDRPAVGREGGAGAGAGGQRGGGLAPHAALELRDGIRGVPAPRPRPGHPHLRAPPRPRRTSQARRRCPHPALRKRVLDGRPVVPPHRRPGDRLPGGGDHPEHDALRPQGAAGIWAGRGDSRKGYLCCWGGSYAPVWGAVLERWRYPVPGGYPRRAPPREHVGRPCGRPHRQARRRRWGVRHVLRVVRALRPGGRVRRRRRDRGGRGGGGAGAGP